MGPVGGVLVEGEEGGGIGFDCGAEGESGGLDVVGLWVERFRGHLGSRGGEAFGKLPLVKICATIAVEVLRNGDGEKKAGNRQPPRRSKHESLLIVLYVMGLADNGSGIEKASADGRLLRVDPP